MRARGTELEAYVHDRKKKSARKSADPRLEPGSERASWRDKHEELIKAMRAAKQLHLHLANGGKASDLPPPEPSVNNNPMCAHCGRKFAAASLERHEPICANTVHKPNAPPSRRRNANIGGGVGVKSGRR
ncbi:hypothetical protein SeMB42_g05045 [Synchytrium endobioticum]|nr:hypothetical protein SeMB42_g05045 [Synchytrium endobioticum]